MSRLSLIDELEQRRLLTADPFTIETMLWKGKQVEVAAGQWIVQLDHMSGKPGAQMARARDFVQFDAPGFAVTSQLGSDGLFRIDGPVGEAADAVVAQLSHLPGFRFAEPDMILHADVVPNDTSYGSLWGMSNIQAPTAWDTATGTNTTVVGVIDTGIDYNHPDLAANVWTNPGEIAGNGIDDDGNGFIDDIHGWDFLNGDNDPIDDNSHGTHVSGTIGAVGNNNRGVVGVNWNVKVMGLKFLGSNGSGPTSAAVQCVNYAVMMHNRGVNINVTNNSWGGGGFDSSLYNAIANYGNAGMLFVAAAGNDGANLDAGNFSYPASYNLPNIIAVANITSTNALNSGSNYGVTQVDLGAPGTGILSTTPNNTYSSFTGTSMASPHVAGVAALLESMRPNATYQTVRDAILSTVTPTASLSGKTVTGGRLNAMGAVQAFASLPDLTAASDSGDSSTDDYTDINTPTFTGTASPNVLVSLFANGNPVGSATADVNGDYSVTSSTLADGTYGMTATWPGQTTPAAPLTIIVDTVSTPPLAPALNTGDDSGVSNTDLITNATTEHFSGTTEGGTVRFYVDGVLSDTAVAGPGQSYAFTASGLTDGTHTFWTTVADRAGNPESAQGSSMSVTVKTFAGVPTVPDLDPTRDSSSNSDNITKFTLLKFNGTSDNGTLFIKVDGNPAGSINVTNGTYTVNATLSEGTHSVQSYVVDLAGNTSALSTGLSVTVDTTRPSVAGTNYAFDAATASYLITFSEDVHTTLQKSDLLLSNVDTGDPVSSTLTSLSYDTPTNVGRFTFPGFANGVLPDGNYQAVLPANAVSDIAGNQLVDSMTDFYVLAADGNRDRSVDTIDFNILAANFSNAGTFSTGDFDYSGTVDTLDFNILAANFSKSLPEPPPPEIQSPAAGALPQTSSQSSLFGTSPIANHSLADDLLVGSTGGALPA